MSTDLDVVTILKVKGKVAELRVRTDNAPEMNGYSRTRAFALQLLEEAWRRARDEGFKVPKKPRPIDLEAARWGNYTEWMTDAFMKKHVATYIARTRILARLNVCDGSREAKDELIRIQDKLEIMDPPLEREDAAAKDLHHILLEVTVTNAKWLQGLKAGMVFGTTAYDLWDDDPLTPKDPPGTPWAWKPPTSKTKGAKAKAAPAKKKTKPGGVPELDDKFAVAVGDADTATALARITGGHVDPKARYVVRDHKLEAYESTALLVAIHQEAIVNALLKLGADPTARDSRGNTALMLTGELKLFTKLLDAGTDIHARNKDGENVLHLCASSDLPDIAKLALKHGVDATVKNTHGKTPLDIAKEYSSATLALIDPPTLDKRLAQVSKNFFGGAELPALLAVLWEEQIETGSSLLTKLDKLELIAFPEEVSYSMDAYWAKKRKKHLNWFARRKRDGAAFALYRHDKKQSLVVIRLVGQDHYIAFGQSLEEFIALHADETKTTAAAKKWFAAHELEWPDIAAVKQAARLLPTPDLVT